MIYKVDCGVLICAANIVFIFRKWITELKKTFRYDFDVFWIMSFFRHKRITVFLQSVFSSVEFAYEIRFHFLLN